MSDLRTEFKGAIRARRNGDITALIGFVQRADAFAESRTYAARSLGKLREPLAVDALLSVLDDPSFSVRAAATTALGHIGDRRAGAPLNSRLAATDDPAEMILILNALHRLGHQPDDRAATRLAAHPNPRVRKALFRAIGRPKRLLLWR